MVEANQGLSEVVPLVNAIVLCDVASTDPASGKKNLIGVFGNVMVTAFPTKRPMHLYVRMTDAVGRYEIHVRYVQSGTGMVLAQATGAANAPDPLQAGEFLIEWPPLPVPVEGRYEFQVWANSIFLGSTYFVASRAPAPSGGG